MTSPIAALLDLSCSLHRNAPRGLSTPASLLRSIASPLSNGGSGVLDTSAAGSVANALTIPPIHVDHVADAVCVALSEEIEGVVGVDRMRELIGWPRRNPDQAGD